MKKGTPMMLVRMPMGTSVAKSRREKLSTMSKNALPMTMEVGSSTR